jgi:signal transduction histidine kinase
MRQNVRDQIPYLEKIKHELKSPIHGIKSLVEYLDFVLDRISTEDQRKCISSILESIVKLEILVGEISYENLVQTSIKFNFAEDDIVAVTKKIVENFKSTYLLNTKVSVLTNAEVNEFVLEFDKFWYEQLLVNILSNSLNYSAEGIILVNMCLEKEKDNILKLSISDEGTGIPESEISNIFTPYNRSSVTKSESSGTGLGLYICREIVEAHGGRIAVENKKDKGAVVTLSMPKKAR